MKAHMPLIILFFFVSIVAVAADTSIDVYRDGYLGVTQTIDVDELELVVEVGLFSSGVEDLFVTDGTGEPLYYEADGDDLLIYNLGGDTVIVSYFTAALTTKEGIVWSIELDTDGDSTFKLPEGSSIIYIDPIPKEIDLDQNEIKFQGGEHVTIDYLFGIEEETNDGWGAKAPFLAAGALLAIVISLVLVRGRGRKMEWAGDKRLDNVEKRVLTFISENEGVMESEIREKFELPKTSSWRMMKRLQDYGYITIVKRNKVNFVDLSKRS